jgi:methylated-DNA-[protein]-cysteine S-methyltransferase
MERTAWLRWLESYSEGKPLPLPFPLSLQGLSPFTRVVLAELQNIPFGKSMSYKALAESVGSPKAYRAAGSACGRNPLPLIVPCHRILAHSQKIGGFSLDLSLKCLLLDFEKISYHL